MKAACFFVLARGIALLFAGCDLFLNTPEKDARSGAEYEVWLAKAPHLRAAQRCQASDLACEPDCNHFQPILPVNSSPSFRAPGCHDRSFACPGMRLVVFCMQEADMNDAAVLLDEIQSLPPNLVAEVLDFVGYLKQKSRKAEKSILPHFTNAQIEEWAQAPEIQAIVGALKGADLPPDVTMKDIREMRLAEKYGI
ncbi:DUF2281 domain-containing protein [Treponema primitia]|uniref:DUF2281 domain-containing protein n=1 Tax=Treponema primitia TaxID=88058 RepID=UPI003981337C